MADVSFEKINKVTTFAKSIDEEVLIRNGDLFGSYASGRANEVSDVISDDFEKSLRFPVIYNL